MTRTNNELKSALENVFAKYPKEKVSAVYVTGSQLNNLTNENSDVDLYVVLKQSKKNAVLGNLVSKQISGEDDFKVMEEYRLLQLLYKVNPTMLELFHERPVYVSEEFRSASEWLYENRNNLHKMNQRRYFSSSYHMAENNLRKCKRGKLEGKQGKAYVQIRKGYLQSMATSRGEDVRPFVVVEGGLRDELLAVKKQGVVTEEQLTEMEQMVDEMHKLNEERKELEWADESVFEELLEFF